MDGLCRSHKPLFIKRVLSSLDATSPPVFRQIPPFSAIFRPPAANPSLLPADPPPPGANPRRRAALRHRYIRTTLPERRDVSAASASASAAMASSSPTIGAAPSSTSAKWSISRA